MSGTLAAGTDTAKTEADGLDAFERAALEEDAKAGFERLLEWARGEAAQSEDLHEVERGLFNRLLQLGRTVLLIHLAERGTGKGEDEVLRDGVKLPYQGDKARTYLSIFGTIEIDRAYFWKKGETGVCPLDAALNLPETRYSYFLQELADLIGVGQPYDRVTERLEEVFGVSLWKQGAQKVVRQAANHVQEFYEQKPPPPAEEEGELLAAAVDGKGVPMVRKRPPEQYASSGGPRRDLKKESVVSAVYTIERNVRTADDIVRDLDDEGYVIERDEERPPRPEPQHKRVRATLRGKAAAFKEVRRLFDQRDPDGTKERVVLTDGDKALQEGARSLDNGSGITLVLDLLHVLTYLWPAAYAFHEEGSVAAARWVMEKVRLLLEGKVGYVIGSLRQSVTKRRLRGSKRRAVEDAIHYMENNRQFMRYDVYLAKGYPIGSGVVEGACRHLVKDRMELAGMRWSPDGAEAVLQLRAVEINGDWREFCRFQVEEEHTRLYSGITRRNLEGVEYWPRERRPAA